MERRAPSTGMLVKRLTTSKLTIRSPTFTISFLILCANLAEFFTNELVLPVSVDRILGSSLTSLYVREPIDATIGKSGIPSLWTLGRP